MNKVLDWSQRFGFGEPRPVSKIKNIFIHTTENGFSTPAENVANWQLQKKNGSYHKLVDREKVLIENTDDWLTWSTGNLGNDIGLHLSFVAFASSKREAWLEEEKNYGTLTRAAAQVAAWAKKHNIPLTEIDAAGLRAGRRGVSTHNAARVWGGTDHTDPGAGFPMDVLLAKARSINTPPKETNDMFTNEDRKKLETIHHELTHRFASRVDTDAGKDVPFRDSAIGYALEADKKLELADGTKLAAAFARLEAKIDALAKDK